ncbi:MAG TPA: hypothetical protein VK578_10360 [Edaphobacter sp.]|nr:hypothetical protein [Edaphobacter sp.]
MKVRILNICVAALLIAAGFVWGNRSVVLAQQHTSVVPKTWGHAVGGAANILIFEDADGVIRFVNPNNGEMTIQVNRK